MYLEQSVCTDGWTVFNSFVKHVCKDQGLMYCVDLVKLGLSMSFHLTVSICWAYQHFSQKTFTLGL